MGFTWYKQPTYHSIVNQSILLIHFQQVMSPRAATTQQSIIDSSYSNPKTPGDSQAKGSSSFKGQRVYFIQRPKGLFHSQAKGSISFKGQRVYSIHRPKGLFHSKCPHQRIVVTNSTSCPKKTSDHGSSNTQDTGIYSSQLENTEHQSKCPRKTVEQSSQLRYSEPATMAIKSITIQSAYYKAFKFDLFIEQVGIQFFRHQSSSPGLCSCHNHSFAVPCCIMGVWPMVLHHGGVLRFAAAPVLQLPRMVAIRWQISMGFTWYKQPTYHSIVNQSILLIHFQQPIKKFKNLQKFEKPIVLMQILTLRMLVSD